jgi:hypothetical protein
MSTRQTCFKLALIVLLGAAVLASRSLASERKIVVTWDALSRPIIAIDAGDTIIWELSSNTYPSTLTSYLQDWVSPTLTNTGDIYAHQFSEPGFYAYHLEQRGFLSLPAAITVLPWTNQQPQITINYPVDGLGFASHVQSVLMEATVRLPGTNIDRVEFFVNGASAGVLANSPFSLSWTPAITGDVKPYSLAASVRDQHGILYWSRPVNFWVNGDPGGYTAVSSPHLLPNGTFICFYSISIFADHVAMIGEQNFHRYGGNDIQGGEIQGEGVFADLFAGKTNAYRFYWAQNYLR